MAKTLAELVSLVVENCRREDKEPLIIEAINFALEEIVQIHPWNDLRAIYDGVVQQGQNNFVIPGNVSQVTEVRLLAPGTPVSTSIDNVVTTGLGYVVEILSQKSVETRWPELSVATSGVPGYCFITGSQIFFNCPLNADKIVRLLADSFAPELNDDEDTNPLQGTDHAVVCWATAYVFRSIEEFENSQEWQKQYVLALRTAVLNNDRKPGQRRQMKGAMTEMPQYLDYRTNTYTRQ